MDEEIQREPLIGTSTVRGVLLLGGVATVAYLAFKYYIAVEQQKAAAPAPVTIPIGVPVKHHASSAMQRGAIVTR